MIGKNRTPEFDEEKIILKTRPRIFTYSKSIIFKMILLGLLIYFINPIISLTVTIQSYLIEFVQFPLVQLVTILLVLTIFILITWGLGDLISWHFIEYVLTNQRVIVQKGFINKKRSFMHYHKVQDIVIYQSIVQRIFASGDIEVFSAHGNTPLILEEVPQPYQIEDKINRMIDKNVSYSDIAREIEKEIKEDSEPKPYPSAKRRDKKIIMDQHSQKFKRKF